MSEITLLAVHVHLNTGEDNELGGMGRVIFPAIQYTRLRRAE